MTERPGRIILLNGTSSSGKSILATALRPALEGQFHYFASDQLADAGFRPTNAQVRWELRPAFFRGFHRSIAAFASAGLDLLVEHIVEEASWAEELHQLLAPLDVFWVGVHASEQELRRREQQRRDRRSGEALEHMDTHCFCNYDIQVDTTQSMPQVVQAIVQAWKDRQIR